ncbi:MAG: polyphosphate kinase 2 family protein [Anaerolineae bacterium]|nr:polyphosphate kinase 2 family protein [Thermoflexales bacterium]MDW8406643.1 polyphosphate kinase 2 family protein [Anaerolineae bacterium]
MSHPASALDTFHRIQPRARVDLSRYDPADTHLYAGRKDDAKQELDTLANRLEVLQELLYAENKHKLLIVLQGMDTSGKDGVIRHVFEGVNPQGVRVANFKAPTPLELSRDYLWRVHAHAPGRGEMVIFNRSHYEDVLIVRVHGLVPEAVWRRRYDHINAFERMLADEGATILKFFLHISKEEQKKRLQARLDDPTKRWKFNVGDLKERARWADYMHAYEDVLSLTSTDWAPWYVVPSDVKWYRNLVIAQVIVGALERLEMRYPSPKEDLSKVVIE